MKTHTTDRSERGAIDALVTELATVDLPASENGTTRPVQIRKLSAGWLGAEWVRFVADYQDAASVGYASLSDLEVDHEITAEDAYGDFEPTEVEISVLLVDEVVGDDVEPGAAYWVTAKIGTDTVQLYAAPRHTGAGIDGLEACGSGIEEWCAPELIAKYGHDRACVLGKEAIAQARI